MKNLLKNYWQWGVIIILGIMVSWPLMRSGYFSHQDDLQVIRIVEMRKCFSDLQIPCRWVPDMGWGNGMPLFNFYGVATYYLGGLLSFIFGYIISAKILFFLALVVGSFGIYLLVNELWGKYAGLTSAILYMYAPYKALDIYVRGALAESIALTIIPFVFYFFLKKKYKFFILTLFLFLITHNIMTIIFIPVLFMWALYCLYQDKFRDIKFAIISFAIAFGLSSFFVLPAFLEKDLVQTESLTRFELDYRANFVSVGKLFLDRMWGYGTSIPGPEGGMNFQIGWPHWLLAIISLVFVFNKKTEKKQKFLILSTFLIFILSALMIHNKSTFIWEKISILTFFQFPWRFLSLSIFTSSILGGFVIYSIKEKYRLLIAVLLIALTVVLNWSYFKPREFYAVSDVDKTTGELWETQRRGAILDYLPKTALEPREGAPISPLITSGKAAISSFENKSNRWKFNIKVLETSIVEVPVYYFPNWEVRVNGEKYPFKYDNILGRIAIELKQGEYKVSGNFRNTTIRNIANLITILSLVGLITIWKNYKN